MTTIWGKLTGELETLSRVRVLVAPCTCLTGAHMLGMKSNYNFKMSFKTQILGIFQM
jgi:hypothetical protein